MTLEEVAHLVKTALPRGRHHDIQDSILPHALSTDELCAAVIDLVRPRRRSDPPLVDRLWDEEPGRAWIIAVA